MGLPGYRSVNLIPQARRAMSFAVLDAPEVEPRKPGFGRLRPRQLRQVLNPIPLIPSSEMRVENNAKRAGSRGLGGQR